MTYALSSSDSIDYTELVVNKGETNTINKIESIEAYQDQLQNKGFGKFDYKPKDGGYTFMDIDFGGGQEEVELGEGLMESEMFSVDVDSTESTFSQEFDLTGL